MNIKSVLAIATGVISLTACKNKELKETPVEVQESFTKHFPGSNPRWEKEDGRFEAAFRWDSHEMSATFEKDGELIESESVITIAELPDGVNDYMKAHYNGIPISEASKITLPDGTIQYEAAIKDRDMIFDANSNFIKEIKD